MQPFEEGLRPSMRMALLELIQNFSEHSPSIPWSLGDRPVFAATKENNSVGSGLWHRYPESLRTVPKYRIMETSDSLNWQR